MLFYNIILFFLLGIEFLKTNDYVANFFLSSKDFNFWNRTISK